MDCPSGFGYIFLKFSLSGKGTGQSQYVGVQTGIRRKCPNRKNRGTTQVVPRKRRGQREAGGLNLSSGCQWTTHGLPGGRRVFWAITPTRAWGGGKGPPGAAHSSGVRVRSTARSAPVTWEGLVIPATGEVTLVSSQAREISVMETPRRSASSATRVKMGAS